MILGVQQGNKSCMVLGDLETEVMNNGSRLRGRKPKNKDTTETKKDMKKNAIKNVSSWTISSSKTFIYMMFQ